MKLKERMKKGISILLAASLILGLMMPALATEPLNAEPDTGRVESASFDKIGKTQENEALAMEYVAEDPTANLISLAGVWQLKLGAYQSGDAAKILGDTCKLPGTLDENKKGNLNGDVDLNKLNRKYTYTGKALYQREVYIPENWQGKHATLLLERTKLTRVWVNGVEQVVYSSNNSLGTPQIYTLSNLIFGQKNVITVEVKNTDYPVTMGTHMLTEETVTNWNGILGRMELAAVDAVYLKDVRVYPNVTNKTATVCSGTVGGAV